ncbi:MAG: FMN-binding negative transcriptional regulator [Burkholderiaceae bacterium]|jgi:transcriptional regulator|nr:FMN-binding negative transcriptional regulator [Burkholderiaceae bacterium]
MYIPAHFAEHRQDELHRIIREHPLGILVSLDADGLANANHIPFELEPSAGGHGQLKAHIARANDLWRQCPTGSPVLVIFRGVDAYISPSWYPSKHETHRQVPTWNYEVVHARGTIVIRDDEHFLRGQAARLTRRQEQPESTPWRMGDAPTDYIDTMLKQIVGIEIQITSLTGKRKLSQNKEDRDRLNAADTLQHRGLHQMADAMRRPG